MGRLASPALDGWLPIHIAWNEPDPAVDWCLVGTRRFTEPFFEQTVEACLRHPFNLLFQRRTPLAELLRWQAERPGLAPTGFIFHVSRCGSTLLAQMLAAVPRNVVISEAPPIDAILRRELRGASEERRIELLRALLGALGQPRAGDEQRLFVKFDSWHAFYLPLIRRAFPQTPWVFLYRDPVEVMVSQLKRRAAHLTPGLIGLEPPGIDAAEAVRLPPEEHCARVLGAIYRAGLEQLRDGGPGRAVNYTELPPAAWSPLQRHFCLECDADELDRMRSVTEFDAKSPTMFFSADSAAKLQAASPVVRELSARWIEPAYAELESLRRGQE